MNQLRKVVFYPINISTCRCFNFNTVKTLTPLDSPTVICLSMAKDQKAFTLVELIVTVVILAIIATLSIPFLLTQLSAMEAKRIRYAISNTLSIAKAESLIRRQDLIVCLSDDKSSCNKNSNSVLLVFADNNDNQSFNSGTDLLLARQPLDSKYGTLHLRASLGRHYIKFFGDTGTPRGHIGHIKYCPSSTYNNAKYQVSFNNVGIIKYKPNSSYPTDCD